ncbi:MAG: hypothetical protein J6A78_04510 [Clostridia bacterium]|nr:hypothetical protein [Oscillospiraceae bacterium]MBO5089525.1 hypothetical protein [Clostridia bacterium]MBO5358564.1 hypothetical protein [Clostridia bacterium]
MQNNTTMTFVKGVGAGMLAGAAAVVVGKMMMKDHKNLERGGAKLLKAAGEMVDGFQTMFH